MTQSADIASLVIVIVACLVQGYAVYLVLNTYRKKPTTYYCLMLICYTSIFIQTALLVTSVSFALAQAGSLHDVYYNATVEPLTIKTFFCMISISVTSQSIGAALLSSLSIRRVSGLAQWSGTSSGKLFEVLINIIFALGMIFAIFVTWLQYRTYPLTDGMKSLCDGVTYERCIQIFSKVRLYNDPGHYLLMFSGICDICCNIYMARYMYNVILSINDTQQQPEIVRVLRPTLNAAIFSIIISLLIGLIFFISSYFADYSTRTIIGYLTNLVISVYMVVVFKVLSKILEIHSSSSMHGSLDTTSQLQRRVSVLGRSPTTPSITSKF